MKFLKLAGLVLTAAALISFSYESKTAKDLKFEVTPVVNKDYLEAALGLIDRAGSSILMIHYEFHMGKGIQDEAIEKIFIALKDAKKRGVKVEIILEDSLDFNGGALKLLKEAGISAKLDENAARGKKGDVFTHNKMILVDGKNVLAGSSNLSGNSLKNNNETNIMIKNHPATAKYFTDYFKKIWADPNSVKGMGAGWDDGIRPVFNREYYENISGLINKASKRVYVMIYSIKLGQGRGENLDLLQNSLIEAKKRGCDVKLIMDYTDNSFAKMTNEINFVTARHYIDKGIAVRFDNPNIFTHAKLLLIDDISVVGGTNWGYGPLNLYNDCNIIIDRKEVTDYFSSYYDGIYGKGTPAADLLANEENPSGGDPDER